MQYADVAVALPVSHIYTYHIPKDFRDDIAVGKRVLIPFGRKYMSGYVVELRESCDLDQVKTSSISWILNR